MKKEKHISTFRGRKKRIKKGKREKIGVVFEEEKRKRGKDSLRKFYTTRDIQELSQMS